jgi:uncharacterized membrane protein YgdD (TMEM256/DUF423 family)
MSARIWIFIAAILGGLAVVAGAIGAHALPDTAALADSKRLFHTGQLYHALHALALLGVGIVLLQTEGWRARFAARFLQLAAVAFLIGIVCFSGGLYLQAMQGFSSGAVVPAGGIAFIAGWTALAIGALGLRS